MSAEHTPDSEKQIEATIQPIKNVDSGKLDGVPITSQTYISRKLKRTKQHAIPITSPEDIHILLGKGVNPSSEEMELVHELRSKVFDIAKRTGMNFKSIGLRAQYDSMSVAKIGRDGLDEGFRLYTSIDLLTLAQRKGYDWEGVLLHEAGHALLDNTKAKKAILDLSSVSSALDSIGYRIESDPSKAKQVIEKKFGDVKIFEKCLDVFEQKVDPAFKALSSKTAIVSADPTEFARWIEGNTDLYKFSRQQLLELGKALSHLPKLPLEGAKSDSPTDISAADIDKAVLRLKKINRNANKRDKALAQLTYALFLGEEYAVDRFSTEQSTNPRALANILRDGMEEDVFRLENKGEELDRIDTDYTKHPSAPRRILRAEATAQGVTLPDDTIRRFRPFSDPRSSTLGEAICIYPKSLLTGRSFEASVEEIDPQRKQEMQQQVEKLWQMVQEKGRLGNPNAASEPPKIQQQTRRAPRDDQRASQQSNWSEHVSNKKTPPKMDGAAWIAILGDKNNGAPER